MSDTQNPGHWLNTSEGFDYTTVVNQTSANLDLSDPATNLSIIDYINVVQPGRGRSFINGLIKQDATDGFYYLSGNPSATQPMTFTQSKDDLDAGHTISMPLSGGLTDENVTSYMYNTKTVRPNSKADYIQQEAQGIEQAYASHGHNSYAYMPNLHPEHVDFPVFQTGEFVSPITQGTGVWTTRMMDHARFGHTSKDWRTVLSINTLNGASTNKVYKSDGVTIDPIRTFYAQQSANPAITTSYGAHWFRNKYQKSTNYQIGIHYALSMSVKLASNIQAGEFVPVVMIDRPTAGSAIMNPSRYDANSSGWRDIRKRVSAMTGTDPDSDDWYKHLTQYHLLTSDSFHPQKRNIKHMVIYIGKPINGNELGGQYEMVIWMAGLQEHITRKWGIRSVINPKHNRTFQPRAFRIPVDDPNDNTYDPSAWTPLFYHGAGSVSHNYQVGSGSYYSNGTKGERSFRTAYGIALAAYGTGIMDLNPANFKYTELLSDLAYRSTHHVRNWNAQWPASFYISQAPSLGWGTHDNGYYMTFLTIPDKVEGIANINQHVYRDNFIVPENSGDEDNRKNLTYFPQRTVQYEAIGSQCEIVNESGNWEDVDFIIDSDTSTSSTAFAVGIENKIEIKTKPAPDKIHQEMNGSNVVKYIEIEIRDIRKKYMNPGLRFQYSLWNYTDPLNPVQVTKNVTIRPANAAENSKQRAYVDLTGQNITYDDLNNCRLRIWVEG